MIERFRSPQGDISSPAGGDLLCPWRLVVAMAQATFSCPFGPIHLESTPLRFRLGIGQNAAGDAADGLRLRCAPPRSIGPPPYPLCRFTTSPPDRGSRPPDPITGVTPWTLCGPSGAQYQECLGAIPSGPTGGLSGKKIGTGAVLFLRLPLTNQRSRPPGRAVLLTDRRPQDRAARTCINPGIEGGPVCCPCGNRATSQDTPSPRAELEPHQPQRRAFHR